AAPARGGGTRGAGDIPDGRLSGAPLASCSSWTTGRPRGDDDVNVKTITALALAAGLALFSLCGEAKAQDPYAEYNRQRAYHLFLTSPSPYRTYSGVAPGYVRRYSTPYAYGEDWQAPT